MGDSDVGRLKNTILVYCSKDMNYGYSVVENICDYSWYPLYLNNSLNYFLIVVLSRIFNCS